MESLYRVICHDQKPLWIFCILTLVIFAPLSWIRTIERFKIGFIFAGITILGMIIVVSIFDIIKINEQDNNAGPGWQPFNKEHFVTMIGLSFYMFEGIGTVLPIMEASDEETKSIFGELIFAALALLVTINIAFSELCYYAFGNEIKEPIFI